MPQREATRTPGGSADLGIVIPGVLLVAALLTRHPVVAERVWQRLGTYPDVTACRTAAASTARPARVLASALAERAEEAAWQAARAASHDARVAGFVTAQTLATGSRLATCIPAFLALGVAGLVLGRIVARREPPVPIDLADRLVLLDTSHLGPPTFELAEMDLPCPPAPRPRDGWTAEDTAELARLRELAARQGMNARSVSRELALLPLSRAARLRSALRADPGLSDADVETYSSGRLWMPRHWPLRRLRRAGVAARFLEAREALRRMGELTPVRERLLRIAAAHASWPASMENHGAVEGGLLEHRASILLETIALVRSATVGVRDRGALLTMAAAHDGGKWISFGRGGNRWVRYDGLHAQHTADIVASLPELVADHGDDARRIVLALGNEYTPDSLPDDFRAACHALVRPIKDIERAVIPAEPDGSIDRAVQEVIGVLPRMVSEMSINRTAGDWQAHGFYEGATERGEETLLLLEAAVRFQLRDYVSQPAQRALGLWRERRAGELHPGFATIAAALLAVGAIPPTVRGVSVTPAMPLVSLRAGKKPFRGAFPLSLKWLGSRMVAEDLVHLKDGWASRGWDVAILGQGVNVAVGTPPRAAAKSSSAAERKPRPEPAPVEPEGKAPPSTPVKPPEPCPGCGRDMKSVRQGSVLACIGTFRGRCHVRFTIEKGEVVRACDRCGKSLVVLRPKQKPAFLRCPDPNCKKASEAAPEAPAKAPKEPSPDA